MILHPFFDNSAITNKSSLDFWCKIQDNYLYEIMKKEGITVTSKIDKTWEALYPLIIYYAILAIAVDMVNRFTGIATYSPMLAQAIEKIICLPFMYYFYRKVSMKGKHGYSLSSVLIVIALGILWSVAINNIIAVMPIREMSDVFQKVNGKIYSDKHLYQLLAAGIVAPILEEITFRGVLFGNLRNAYGRWLAIIVSSLLFGIFHFNMVQFIYATIIGAVFAYIYDKTRSIVLAILAHAAANIMSLAATWYGFLGIITSSTMVTLLSGIIILIVAVVMMVKWKKI